MADMPSCWGYTQSLSFLHRFLLFFLKFSVLHLSSYPSKPSSISISSKAKLKWWEELWNKVVSHIWHHQGKTCQSFCARACLWLWEWAATISGELRLLSHQGKALERTGCKGPSWLDLISGRPINWQDCTASLWTLWIRMRDWRRGRRHNREGKA